MVSPCDDEVGSIPFDPPVSESPQRAQSLILPLRNVDICLYLLLFVSRHRDLKCTWRGRQIQTFPQTYENHKVK